MGDGVGIGGLVTQWAKDDDCKRKPKNRSSVILLSVVHESDSVRIVRSSQSDEPETGVEDLPGSVRCRCDCLLDAKCRTITAASGRIGPLSRARAGRMRGHVGRADSQCPTFCRVGRVALRGGSLGNPRRVDVPPRETGIGRPTCGSGGTVRDTSTSG